MELVTAPGATPLDPDEAAGLLPSHITTQADLNTWEEANILQGERWALRQRKRDLLDEGFVRDLHRRMFDRTWRWAGTFRSSNKNIGVDWSQVSTRLRDQNSGLPRARQRDVGPALPLQVPIHASHALFPEQPELFLRHPVRI